MGSLQNAVAPFKVLIVGGSYAGLSSALNLIDLSSGRAPRMSYETWEHPRPDFKTVPIDITIVDERDGFYHLIGSPLAFASSSFAAKSWVRFQDIPALQRPNVHIVQGSMDKVDASSKTATVLSHITKTPQSLSYDYLIAASGLRRPYPVVPQSLIRKQFLLEAEEHIHAVSTGTDGVVIVGGGAVGIEMAAELKLVHPHVKVTLVHSRHQLLSSEGLSDECKEKALELTREANVEVLLGRRVKNTRALDPETRDASGPAAAAATARPRYEVELSDGSTLIAGHVINAISRPIPSTKYLPSSFLDAEGYVKIQPSLFIEPGEGVPNPESHLVVGDAVKWSGIKRAGGAMHMGHFAARNVHQLILRTLTAGRENVHVPHFKELNPIPPMIGLAVGKKAVAYGPDVGTVSGEDVMQAYFRDDLGFTICWDYMQLGKSQAAEENNASVEVQV